jgi:hypothetical protein
MATLTAIKNIFLVILCGALLAGCAGMGLWAGERSPVADRAFDHPLSLVKKAALDALNEMNIMILDSQSTSEGQTILAATFDLDLTIDLSSIDNDRTQVRVSTHQDSNASGANTAREILDQTERIMRVALNAGNAA